MRVSDRRGPARRGAGLFHPCTAAPVRRRSASAPGERGIVISITVVGAMRRVVAVVVYSAVGGLVLTGILAGWFGALQGDFWVEAGAIALALSAIAAPITGAPPGAAATLLRDVSYFPSVDASFSCLVLAAWTVGGLLLSVVGHVAAGGGAEPDVAAREEDPVPVPA